MRYIRYSSIVIVLFLLPASLSCVSPVRSESQDSSEDTEPSSTIVLTPANDTVEDYFTKVDFLRYAGWKNW